MIKTTLNFNVNNLLKMRDDKKTLDLDHIVQRGFVWSTEMSSKLIESILLGYPIPPIFCLKIPGEKETTYSVMDGKQRICSCLEYCSNSFPLSKDIPSIIWDDEEVELANCYFDDLPQDIQQELLHFKFLIYGFEDISEDEIGELFYRLNNGYLLNKTQKSLSCIDFENVTFIKDILGSKFFQEYCKFTKLQRKNSADLATLLQAMILFHNKYYEYEFSSISDSEILLFANNIKNNYPDDLKFRLYDIVSYLELVFHEPEKQLKKINIPMVMLCADAALGDEYDMNKKLFRIGPKYFYQWFNTFFEDEFEEYSNYCSSGSTRKDKTCMRIELMQNSLITYFELDGDEHYSNGESNSESNGSDETIDTPELEQEEAATSDECESISFVDELLADSEDNSSNE